MERKDRGREIKVTKNTEFSTALRNLKKKKRNNFRTQQDESGEK